MNDVTHGEQPKEGTDGTRAHDGTECSVIKAKICLYFRKARHPSHNAKAEEEEKCVEKLLFLRVVDVFSH